MRSKVDVVACVLILLAFALMLGGVWWWALLGMRPEVRVALLVTAGVLAFIGMIGLAVSDVDSHVTNVYNAVNIDKSKEVSCLKDDSPT